MISTVTVSTISTVTAMAALGFTAKIGIAAVVVLIACMVTKELTGARLSSSYQTVSRFLNVAIVPMIMVFAVIIGIKVMEVLA
jgi:hypothetical protein